MKSREFIAGILFLFLGIFLFILSWELPSGIGGSLGPRYWPQLVLVGIVFLAGILTWRGICSPVQQRSNLKPSGPLPKQILLILILTAGYVFLWSFWDFFISTVLFLFSLMFVLHPKKPIRLFLYSVAIVFVLYASFYWGMRIPFDS